MSKGRALMALSYGKERRDIARKGRKRSLWASVGMAVGGAIAIGLTGGAATPFVAGLMAAGGVAAGGLAASYASKEGFLGSEKTKLKGEGKWMKGTREDVVSDIHSMIGVGAAKAGLFAGFSQAGGWKGLMKKGLDGENISMGEKIFKRAPGSGQTEGFGKVFDFRGSTIGKGLAKAKTQLADFRHTKALAKSDKLYGSTEGFGDSKSEFSNFQFSDQAEGMRVKPYGGRTPTTGGSGTDYTTNLLDDSPFNPELISKMDDQWDALNSSDSVVGGLSPETPQIQYKTPGVKGTLQRILPGGESGYQGEIPKGLGLSAEEVDIRNYYEKVGMDDTTHISRKMSKHTKLQDVGVGENFLESSNIRNTPRYVAGRHGEESYFSRALDTDNISPMDIRGGHQGITMPEIKHIKPNSRVIPGTGSYSSYSGGTGSTSTSAWEGVGESFSVESPNLVGNTGESFSRSPVYTKPKSKITESLGWHNRLFPKPRGQRR